jgi:protein SCO1/2
MHRLFRVSGAALGAALLLGCAALAVSSCGGGGGDDNGGSGSYDGAVITPPVQMPNAVLTDQNGQPFDLQKQTEGDVTLLYIGYTHCPDICPTHMYEIAQGLKGLPKDVTSKVKVVFVTSDPDRDTPAALKTYLASFNPDFIGLTGTQAQLDAFAESIGLPASQKEDLGNGEYAVNHAAFVFAFTKDRKSYTVYPAGMGHKEWINDLPLLVKKGYKP